jgi:hypothetical protein
MLVYVVSSKTSYLVKHIFQLELRQSRTLNILDSAKVLGHALAIFLSHRLHLLLTKLLAHLWVVAQVCLGAYDEARHARAVVVNHFSRTFSKLAGEVTEKQTRNTSVCGYERGRRRS